MKKLLILPMFLLSACQAAAAFEPPASRVDFPGFVNLTEEAGAYRTQRLVDIDSFMKMATEPKTMILDARSESAFARKHIKGAVHLSFSDFSFEGLKQVIPDKNMRILIYCNNNIEGDTQNFPTKAMPLALNIPTFINLYGYGYKNVYELSSLLEASDPRLAFEGTDVVNR
ncbi:MAG: rhodanese-like domain-containing protein [Candidatus Sericytochromatia bacterium]